MNSNQITTSEKLRKIRKSKGWSLQDVEKISLGKWKAVVIGSYERSDRAISLKKAIELMDFYGVPMNALFEETAIPSENTEPFGQLILDQRLIKQNTEPKLEGIKRMITFITSRRKDWNGEVLSLRSSDLQFISILLNEQPKDSVEYLKLKGYLIS
jgi:transcriptional regulator with XRE-family HTH domain